jgi:hypothetical protein
VLKPAAGGLLTPLAGICRIGNCARAAGCADKKIEAARTRNPTGDLRARKVRRRQKPLAQTLSKQTGGLDTTHLEPPGARDVRFFRTQPHAFGRRSAGMSELDRCSRSYSSSHRPACYQAINRYPTPDPARTTRRPANSSTFGMSRITRLPSRGGFPAGRLETFSLNSRLRQTPAPAPNWPCSRR